MIRYWLLIGALLIAPLVYAQTPVEEQENADSTEQITSPLTIEQKVQQLERQMRNQIDWLKKSQALTQQLKDLQGQLEVQANEISILKAQQKSQYSDLDQRLNELNQRIVESVHKTAEKKSTKVTEVTSKESNKKTLINEKAIKTDKEKTSSADKKDIDNDKDKKSGEKAYQAAYTQLKNKNYDKAQIAFTKFIKSYPDDSNLIHAHYWLGFVYLLKNQPDKAIPQFQTVIKLDVNKERTAEATRKIALARSMQKKG